MFVGVTGAGAFQLVDVQHGIGFTKGCTSPTRIGDPYSCSYSSRNVIDEAEDTLTVNSLIDIVHAASGDVNSGNIIGAVQITTTTSPTSGGPSGATCVAASGNGVFPTPYTGVTSCTLPFGSRINVLSFSHYTVQAGDFALPSTNSATTRSWAGTTCATTRRGSPRWPTGRATTRPGRPAASCRTGSARTSTRPSRTSFSGPT
jgi:hypothetical protein